MNAVAPQKGYPVEQNSQTWRSVRDWIEDRLILRRGNLEISGMDQYETENNRGAIEELNELKQLVRPQRIGIVDGSDD